MNSSRLSSIPFALLVAGGLTLCVWAFWDAAQAQRFGSALETVTVTRILDGDTVEIGGQKCRLADIDAPESQGTKWPEQPFAKAAKQYLAQAVIGRTVQVHYGKLDYYHRRLVTIYDGDKNINRDLVEAGLAWPYGHAYEREYEAARAGKFGLWCCGHEISPHDWRHGVRTTSEEEHAR